MFVCLLFVFKKEKLKSELKKKKMGWRGGVVRGGGGGGVKKGRKEEREEKGTWSLMGCVWGLVTSTTTIVGVEVVSLTAMYF